MKLAIISFLIVLVSCATSTQPERSLYNFCNTGWSKSNIFTRLSRYTSTSQIDYIADPFKQVKRRVLFMNAFLGTWPLTKVIYLTVIYRTT